MKVLLINNDKGWSGGQEHLKDLSCELTLLGVQVHFVVRDGSPSHSRYGGLGFTVHPMPKHGLAGDLQGLIMLVKLLRSERFDIVSVNREHDLFMTALAWKIAFPMAETGSFMMSYHTATTRRQPLLGTADAIVCISEHVKSRLLVANPSAAKKTSVLYYGINTGEPPTDEKFCRDRRRRFFDGGAFPMIGMVGEFWKNQGELVGMLPALRQKFPALKAVFVGDDRDEGLVNPLRERIRALGVEDAVLFTGRVPRERIADIFHDFDLSVTTHRNEGFGIVHMESLAAGTPVVCYNEGGQVDLFRGEDVAVVVDGAGAEFTAAVSSLLDDDSRRFAMGRRGRALIEKSFSLKAMGSRYFSFYKSLGS